MKKPKIKAAHGPEYNIQRKLVSYLKDRGWLVERMAMGAFMSGIPDLYVYHPKYGPRWLEVKQKVHYTLTKAQRIKFPIWEHYGIGIWILTDSTEEEYDKLFRPPNWREFWKAEWTDEMDIDKIIEEHYGTD